MDDDNSIQHRQLSKIFRDQFQSTTVQQHHQAYLNHLHEKLNQWKLETNDKIKQLIKEKLDEINHFYTQYCQEINDKYADINQQIDNPTSRIDLNDQIKNFKIYCQSHTIENCIRLHTEPVSRDQFIENIQLEYTRYRDPPIQRTIERLESSIKERTESIHSASTSSRTSPVPLPPERRTKEDHSKPVVRQDELVVQSEEESFIPQPKSSTRMNDMTSKNITRLYVGQRHILTPVLIGKDREVYNETEKITEYSIDSIPLTEDKQEQSSETNSDPDNDIKLVRAYKVLVQAENDYAQSSTTSSDHDDEDDEELSNINQKFNLKKVNQINYTTVMFRKCETEYNCLSSSTRRNELVLYNSKLNVLIILQHEDYQQCRQRFYLQWPKTMSPNISDITYCSNHDQFLISTWDTSHIYFFNRDLLAIQDLGRLSNDSPLRRIHCDGQTIYCILGNNYLLEYQINEDYSSLTIVRKIKLFNPLDHSQDTVYHLLDITCNENYLIIIYANEHDEIHLQSISRQTKEFHHDLLLDTRQPINQKYIRIESTNYHGNFLYLNGSQQHLKAIDLVNYRKGKITSVLRRHTKPTNVCFLKDERLVILYEHPYFLSVHDLNNRQQGN